MALTYPLVTLNEVKTYIKTNTEYKDNDAIYRACAINATKLIEQYTRRKFTKQVYTEYFGTKKAGRHSLDLYGGTLEGYSQVNETQRFYLANTPIDLSEDFSVYFDLKRTWGDNSKLTPDIYWVDPNTGILSIDSFVGRTENTLKVVYTAGYEATMAQGSRDTTLSENAPEDLKLACLITVVNLFNRMQDRQFGMVQMGDTDEHADYSHVGIIPLEAREICNPYRRILIPS